MWVSLEGWMRNTEREVLVKGAGNIDTDVVMREAIPGVDECHYHYINIKFSLHG